VIISGNTQDIHKAIIIPDNFKESLRRSVKNT
jgi:hypothetical protein